MGQDDPRPSPALPVGTVTFLLTDIERSSAAWESDHDRMAAAVARHYEILDEAASRFEGVRPVDQGEGDSVLVAFARATDAVAAALEAQRRLISETALAVRMAIHTGEAQLRDERNYWGNAVNRCGRLRALAYGGQTLVSRSTYELVVDHLPDRASLQHLGSYRLRDLSRPEDIWQLCHPDLPPEFPSLRSLDTIPNNLPIQTTSFIGRERESAEVEQHVGSTRLLTLTGPGGCGKTRLALEAASHLLDSFPDGAWWVDLARLSQADLVPKTVAMALSVQEIPNQPILETLERTMHDQRRLVLLDNCEHVIGACADLTERLLRGTPSTSFLATSREPLGVAGEVAYRIPSLSLPPDTRGPIDSLSRYEAVRLFIDRAVRARPAFQATNETAPAIAEICHRLDGIPLAIELAAARARALTPDQIAKGLDDVFRMVAGGARTALPRERTLEASIDWSHDLLEYEERVLLRRLSVFVGGFVLDAAEEICAGEGIDRDDVLDLLSGLIDKSLVQMEDVPDGARYRLLETMRQYAGRKLREAGEEASVRDRHLDFFVAFGERAQPGLEGHGHAEWVEVVQTELGNVRAALDWSLEQPDGTPGLRLVGALWAFWIARSAAEGRARLEAALAHPNADRAARPPALVAGWDLSLTFGDPITANAFGDEAVAICRELGDTKLLGRALLAAGWPKVFLDPPSARPLLEEGVDLSKSASDPLCTADCLAAIGFLEIGAGSLASGRTHLEQAVTASRLCGLPVLIVRTLLFLGWDLHLLTDLGPAAASLREALEIASTMRESKWTNFCRAELAVVELLRGSVDEAYTESVQALAEGREMLNGYGIAMSAFGAGQAALAGGDLATATAAFTEGIPIQALVGLRWLEVWSQAALAEIAVANGDLSSARAHIDEAGEVVKSFPGTLAEGRVHHARAALATSADDLIAAEAAAHNALQLFSEAEHKQGVVEVLERLAGLLADLESFAEAARLLGAAQAAREAIGYVRFPVDTPVFDGAADRCRVAMGEQSFESAFGEGLGLRLDEAVAYASRGRGSRKRPSTGWASLTPAEVDVVRLVAEGLTNAEIGTRLFISPRTVQAHLARVFTRLGVTSRTELATEAIRRGIASA